MPDTSFYLLQMEEGGLGITTASVRIYISLSHIYSSISIITYISHTFITNHVSTGA
jgi:hypothetical protein